MKRKFVRVMFFGALALSTVTYVGCKDYDDDIDNLQTQIDANKASIAELQKFVNDGKWVTSVDPISGGFKITFSDGKTYEVVNGAKGETGAKGENGAPGSKVTIDPETGEWLIDGKETGWFAKGKDGLAGQDGHSPFIADGTNGDKGYWYYWDDKEAKYVKGVKAQGENGESITGTDGKSPYINEEGYWCYWDAEGNPVTGAYAQTSVYLVQEADKPAYTLHIGVETKNADGTISYTPTTINLPSADAVSSIKAIYIVNGTIRLSTTTNSIALYYGEAAADVEFNGVSYKEDQVLTSNSGEIYAQVNPSDVDFSKYNIYLQNSKGSTAYEVKEVTPYNELLTRAAPVSGLYKLKIGFVQSANIDDIVKNGRSVAYALSTKNAFDKTILSEYNLAINPIAQAQDLRAITLTTLDKSYNYNHQLSELLVEAGVENLDYIVDYTVETTSSDVVIDNKVKTIKSTKGQTVELTVKYLRVNGTIGELAQKVKINFCEMVTVGDIALTLKEGVTGATETVKAAFDDKANALLAGGATVSIANTNPASLTLSDGTVLAASLIAGSTDKFELSATFVPTTVEEGERPVVLEFKKNNAVLAKANAKITVTVDNEGVFKFHQKEIYFTTEENLAIVYGTPSATNVTHNLFDLLNEEVAGAYEEFDATTKAKIDFEETPPTFADGTTGRSWITSGGNISVPQYRATNNDGVKSERPFVAKYYQFGNRNLTPIPCEFMLTVESAIEKGKHADLPVADARTLSMAKKEFDLKATDFAWKDVYNANITWASDTRIVSMELTPNAIAKQYIDITPGTDLKTAAGNKVKISLKTDLQQIVKDEPNSAITLTVTDQWGVKTTVNIPVPIKK